MPDKRILFLVLWVCLIPCIVVGQQVVSSTGKSYSNNNLKVDFTIGEFMIHTCKSKDINITQGFHQPLIRIANAEEPVVFNEMISIYPNPSSELIIIQVDAFEELTYSLYDLSGNVLELGKIENKLTELSVQELLPAIYFIQITNDQSVLRVFEIVKE